jgi:hypothetical protein
MSSVTVTATKNRRKFIRIPSSCQLTTQKILFSAKADSETYGQAQNICAGGVLFVAPRDFHRDELVKMSITLPRWKKHHPQFFRADEDDVNVPITAICQIIRSQNLTDGRYEVAARFVDVYEDDLEGLTRFIEAEAERLGVGA